jgi:hypothetical protein
VDKQGTTNRCRGTLSQYQHAVALEMLEKWILVFGRKGLTENALAEPVAPAMDSAYFM